MFNFRVFLLLVFLIVYYGGGDAGINQALLPLFTIRNFTSQSTEEGKIKENTEDSLIEEVEEGSSSKVYIVNNQTENTLVAIYPTKRELQANSFQLFGLAVGKDRLNTILLNGGILHTTKGTFMISVSGLDI